jgi:hypothetical protein
MAHRLSVVVVRSNGVSRWFGDVLDDEVTQLLAAWIGAGADGPLPEALASREFDRDDHRRGRGETKRAEPVTLTGSRR